jgi:hypothetical protein
MASKVGALVRAHRNLGNIISQGSCITMWYDAQFWIGRKGLLSVHQRMR